MSLPHATTLRNSRVDLDPAAKKTAISPMIGGGQAELSQRDLDPISFTIKIQCQAQTDDRSSDPCLPAYEVPLMRRRYRREGGDLHVMLAWLPARMNYSRVFQLNRDMIRVEAMRLDGSYRLQLQNGGAHKFFTEVYGFNGNAIKRFHEVITAQAKFWQQLDARMRQGYKLTLDDLNALIDIAEPPAAEIEEIEMQSVGLDPVDGQGDAQPDEDGTIAMVGGEAESIEDQRNNSLVQFLTGKGYELSEITAVLVAVEQNPGKELKAKDISSQDKGLVGKKTRLYQLLNDWKTFTRLWEQKAAKLEAEAADAKTADEVASAELPALET